MGLQYSTAAYNVHVASIPMYIAQLENYPEEFQAVEAALLRQVARGPFAWALLPDLHRLRDHFGQAHNFRDLRNASIAAKVRVCQFENAGHGGLQVVRRARRLRGVVYATEHGFRRHLWKPWLETNPLFNLEAALEQCQEVGISADAILAEAAGYPAQRPWTLAESNRARTRFQATVGSALRRHDYRAEERMRNKLQRWQTPGLPGRAARTAIRHLEELSRIAPPRVCAAVLSTMWNRWTTARRFQSQGRCVLGCSCSASVVRTVALRCLNLKLRSPPHAVADFVLASLPPADADASSVLLRMGMLIYAVYTATNSARHERPGDCSEAADMLTQAISNAAAGHRRSEAELRTAWGQRQVA